ncbi:MAG: hypothetical protein ACOC56_00395 [Atribacterota bacterium]
MDKEIMKEIRKDVRKAEINQDIEKKPTREEFKQELLEKIHTDLCNLEDLTDYKIKNISKCIDLIQKTKL